MFELLQPTLLFGSDVSVWIRVPFWFPSLLSSFVNEGTIHLSLVFFLWVFMGFDTNSALFFFFFFFQTKVEGGGGGRFLAPHYKSSVPSALNWVLEHFSVTPVLNGGEKCGGRFPGPSPSVLGSEWTLTQGLVELPNGQSWFSLCHLFQLSSVSFPFSSNPWQQGRLLSSELGRASGLCPPYVFSDLAGS